MEKNYEKQKCLGYVLVFLSCKTCLQKFLSWFHSLNLETVERKGKQMAKH